KEIFDCPEGNTLPHIIACRFTGCFKYAPVHQQAWTEMADGIDIAETTCQAQDRQAPRRTVTVRRQIEKQGGREKIKQPELFTGDEKPGNYRYSCCIANLTLPARVAYDACRGRAGPENRIKELKHDFSTDRLPCMISGPLKPAEISS
ncbi:MAG: hypothetical protein LBB73_07970, partial [Dysgonamonadaceae bacterium]|nr:hypothetical protein [Dysgonamonadaceae bacterium]